MRKLPWESRLDWRNELHAVMPRWDTSLMWRVVASHSRGVKEATRQFADAWIQECHDGAQREDRCDELVRWQEMFNKGSRARLRPGNQEAINHTVGLTEMEFRFRQVRALVRDIHEALHPGGNGHA